MSDTVPHCVIYRIEAAIYEKRPDGNFEPTPKTTTKELVVHEVRTLAKAEQQLSDTIKKVKNV